MEQKEREVGEVHAVRSARQVRGAPNGKRYSTEISVATIRFFGALTSGELETTLPKSSGGVWRQRGDPPDFTRTFAAIDALVSRGIEPFFTLSFFPQAVSENTVTPPSDYFAWEELVRAFIDALSVRYGSATISSGRFEVWNEPNFNPFWAGDFDKYLDLYRATCRAVKSTGQALRLGGPALVYTPDSDGAELMERFLIMLAQEPDLLCDFVSYHRKGSWRHDEWDDMFTETQRDPHGRVNTRLKNR